MWFRVDRKYVNDTNPFVSPFLNRVNSKLNWWCINKVIIRIKGQIVFWDLWDVELCTLFNKWIVLGIDFRYFIPIFRNSNSWPIFGFLFVLFTDILLTLKQLVSWYSEILDFFLLIWYLTPLFHHSLKLWKMRYVDHWQLTPSSLQ